MKFARALEGAISSLRDGDVVKIYGTPCVCVCVRERERERERENLVAGPVKNQRHWTRDCLDRKRIGTFRVRSNKFFLVPLSPFSLFFFLPPSRFSVFPLAQKRTPANETPPLSGFSPRSACLVKSPRTGVARRLLLFSGGRTLDTLLSGCTGVPLQRNRVITTYTSHDIPPLNQDG